MFNSLNNQHSAYFLSGSKVSRARVVGVSVLLGSMTFWPHVAYAMDGEQSHIMRPN